MWWSSYALTGGSSRRLRRQVTKVIPSLAAKAALGLSRLRVARAVETELLALPILVVQAVLQALPVLEMVLNIRRRVRRARPVATAIRTLPVLQGVAMLQQTPRRLMRRGLTVRHRQGRRVGTVARTSRDKTRGATSMVTVMMLQERMLKASVAVEATAESRGGMVKAAHHHRQQSTHIIETAVVATLRRRLRTRGRSA